MADIGFNTNTCQQHIIFQSTGFLTQFTDLSIPASGCCYSLITDSELLHAA